MAFKHASAAKLGMVSAHFAQLPILTSCTSYRIQCPWLLGGQALTAEGYTWRLSLLPVDHGKRCMVDFCANQQGILRMLDRTERYEQHQLI
jgi:hypothetical protein